MCSNAPILTICDEEVFESETVTDDSHAIPLEQAMNTLFSYLIDNGVCTKGQILRMDQSRRHSESRC